MIRFLDLADAVTAPGHHSLRRPDWGSGSTDPV